MKFKGTATLFALLLVLGGWVYWTDIRGREERERAAEDAALAFPADSENIRRVRLVYPEYSIEGARNEGSWEFVSPSGLEADLGAWDALASSIPRIERDETIVSEPADLAAFGLDSPNIGVEVELSDGRVEEILFGRENPGRTHYYAKLGSSDEVFLAPNSWIPTMSKEVNDLRNKEVLRFEQDAIDRIEITGGANVSLSLRDEWLIESPLEWPADSAEVSTFLGAVGFARATGFADEEITTAELGLDPPRLRIALHDNEIDGEHVLLIGAQANNEPGSHFAKDASRDTVFIVNNTIVETAEQPIFEWRDKSIAAFNRPDVSRIRVERQEDNFVVSMGAEGWEFPDQQPVRPDAITRMFDAIEFERVTDIIDAPGPLNRYGLDPARLRVVFEAGVDEILAFEFGDDAEDEGSLYWKSEAETEIKVVSKDVFDRFDVTAEDILDFVPLNTPQ